MSENRDKIIATITDDPGNAADTMIELQVELTRNQNTLNQLRRNLSAAAGCIGLLLPYVSKEFNSEQYQEIVDEINNFNSLANSENGPPPSPQPTD